VLTALILFGWPYVSHYFFPAANPPVTRIEDGKTTPVAAPGTGPAISGTTAVRDRNLVLKESPRIPIRTPKLVGSINLKGARIDDIVLPTYRETIEKASPAIRL
jgi:YidC/Oxa1 family membrane protein insertase